MHIPHIVILAAVAVGIFLVWKHRAAIKSVIVK